MNDAGEEDGQVFDALSEESFDFGHFHELDSDAEEPIVEHESLDPFTAAQREESFLHGTPVDEDDTDDKFAFTQRLLTNAQTLKQLRASGAPEVEIEYEQDQSAHVIDVDNGKESQKSNAARLPVPSQVSTSTTIYSQHDQPLHNNFDEVMRTPKPYISLTQRTYKSLQSLGDETMVTGKYHEFPSRLLKPYSLEQCKIILEQTRLYVPSARTCSDAICLQDIFHAKDIRECPVYEIVQSRDSRVLLRDVHADNPCSVIAILETVDHEIADGTHIKLLVFHFDHAATLDAMSKNVTMSEELDESFYMTPDDPPPAAQSSTQSAAAVPEMQSILMIAEYEIVSIDALRREWQKQEDMKRMFESDVPLVTTQGTAGTDYSDPYGEHLDMNDFPVNQVG